MSDSNGGGGSSVVGRVIAFVLLAALAWLAAGTEWSLAFEKEAFLRGIAIEDPTRNEDDCEAAIDFTGVPAAPTEVSVKRGVGREVLSLESGRGTLTYPHGQGGVELRLTFVGALQKPSHADITFAQRGCGLQPASFSSMPMLPF